MCSFPDASPVVVASHPRSGTHLVIDLLRRHFPDCQIRKAWGQRLDRLYCNVDELMNNDGALTEPEAFDILSRADMPVIKTHSFPSFESGFFEDHRQSLPHRWTEWLDAHASVVYVHRHPCDVMASYHQFRASYEAASRTALSDFIRAEHDGASRIERWANHIRAWTRRPDVLAIRFSDILSSPASIVERISTHLGISPVLQSPLLPRPFESVWESRLARLFQTFPESTAIINGKNCNDLGTQLTAKDRAYILDTCGNLLQQLGYKNPDSDI